MRKARFLRLFSLAPAIAALLIAPTAEAQVTGSIVGAVKDASGAVLSGATVTLRGGTLTAEGLTTTSDNNDPDEDFGPSNQSVPNAFVASGLVRMPWDLTLSGIFNWRSGIAFNPRGIRDLDGDGLVDQRDTTVGRNDFRTPEYVNFDARLEKAFRFGGTHALSVLVEGYNLLNRGNVKNITNVSGAEFGTPTEYFPGREIQFGFRYLFGR